MDRKTKIGLLSLLGLFLFSFGVGQYNKLSAAERKAEVIHHFRFCIPFVPGDVAVLEDGDNDIIIMTSRNFGLDGYIVDSGNSHQCVIFDPAKTDAEKDFKTKHPLNKTNVTFQ